MAVFLLSTRFSLLHSRVKKGRDVSLLAALDNNASDGSIESSTVQRGLHRIQRIPKRRLSSAMDAANLGSPSSPRLGGGGFSQSMALGGFGSPVASPAKSTAASRRTAVTTDFSPHEDLLETVHDRERVAVETLLEEAEPVPRRSPDVVLASATSDNVAPAPVSAPQAQPTVARSPPPQDDLALYEDSGPLLPAKKKGKRAVVGNVLGRWRRGSLG